MAKTALDLRALVTAGAIHGVDVSPDGRTITFGSSANGRSRIYVQPLADPSGLRQLTSGEQSATQPKWSPRGDLIAFLEDVGGDENYRILVTDPDGKAVQDVTQTPGTLHESHAWSRDGSQIAFVSNRDGQFDVYTTSVATGSVRRVTNYPAVHHSPEFSPDGSHISYSSNRTEYRGNWDTFVAPVDGGPERKVTEHSGEADEMSYYAAQRPYWSPEGDSILVGSSVRGNYDIMSIDVGSLQRGWLADSPMDETNGQWSPDGTRLAYVVNRAGNLMICVRDLRSGRTWPVSHQEGSSGVIGMRGKGADYRWMPDGESIVYGYYGAREAGSIWLVSVETGETRLLYSSMPAEVNRDLLRAPTLVTYPSFDGTPISGLLFQPEHPSGIGPAIVFPHGGPTGQSTNVWSPLIQYLVSLGYVVFEPNYRGSSGYGREFQWLNRYDWAGGDLQDVVAAADWLESESIARGVGIMGGSYGGFMALSAATRFPDRWGAVASIFGIANLVTMYRTAREDMRHFQERNIGTPEENPEFYQDRSPLNHVESIEAPLLILQGERDPRVPMSEAEQIAARLSQAGKEFEFVVYRDEGHGFTHLDSRIDYIDRIAQFSGNTFPPVQAEC